MYAGVHPFDDRPSCPVRPRKHEGRKTGNRSQLIALREYTGKQGWEIAAEYVDHETDGIAKRPRFQAMFATRGSVSILARGASVERRCLGS